MLRPFLHRDELVLEMNLPVKKEGDRRRNVDQSHAVFVGGIDEPRVTGRESGTADFRVTRNVTQ